MPFKQYSNYSGKTFVADLPPGWALVPPNVAGPLEAISQEEFNSLKKEEIGTILVDGERYSLFELT